MLIRRNLRIAALLFAVGTAASGAPGCARTHDRERPRDEDADGDPDGVFADLGVLVRLYEGFGEPVGDGVTHSAHVFINGGTRDGRVPDLRAFHNDVEMSESGSAGLPEQFSYQGRDHTVRAKIPSTLRLNLHEARYSISVGPSGVAFSSPDEGAALTTRGEFAVRWMGSEQRPTSMGISVLNAASCKVRLGTSESGERETIFKLAAAGDVEPGLCQLEVNARWTLEDEPVADTPFRTFVISRDVRQTRRFTVELVR
jgi:hypothetical protein